MWQALVSEIRQQHLLYDQKSFAAIREYMAAGRRIYCGRGCRGCCNLAVSCAFSEAVPIAAVLGEKESDTLEDHVDRLRRQVGPATDLKTYLRLHRKEIGSCPFLAEDGTCAIYETRPFACRSLLSTRPAEWCAVDFADVDPFEKQAYLSSLDPAVVAWPTHYLGASRDMAQEFEAAAAWRMRDVFGFTLSGSLPVLVWMEKRHRLGERASEGKEAVRLLLEREGLDIPLMVALDG